LQLTEFLTRKDFDEGNLDNAFVRMQLRQIPFLASSKRLVSKARFPSSAVKQSGNPDMKR
jgi:hypothetical protein